MNRQTIARSITASILLAMLATAPAWAAVGAIYGKVVAVLIQEGTDFGGCMVHLDPSPATAAGVNCADGWVSFSCSGDFVDAVRAYRMLDQAQLAFATDKHVFVVMDDSRKHNGYCFASRIDLAP